MITTEEFLEVLAMPQPSIPDSCEYAREGNDPVPSAFSGQSWRAADSHFQLSVEWRVELRESCLGPAFVGDSQSDAGRSL